MRVQNIIPNHRIAGYVDRVLILENDVFLKPFILPLYANGVPTLLFKSVKGRGGTPLAYNGRTNGIRKISFSITNILSTWSVIL